MLNVECFSIIGLQQKDRTVLSGLDHGMPHVLRSTVLSSSESQKDSNNMYMNKTDLLMTSAL